jgi:hypothetical protein
MVRTSYVGVTLLLVHSQLKKPITSNPNFTYNQEKTFGKLFGIHTSGQRSLPSYGSLCRITYLHGTISGKEGSLDRGLPPLHATRGVYGESLKSMFF